MNGKTILPAAIFFILLFCSSILAQSSKEFVNGQGRFAINPSSSASIQARLVEDAFGSFSAFGNSFVWDDSERFVSATVIVPWQKLATTWKVDLPPAAKLQVVNYYKKLIRDDFAKQSANATEVPYTLHDPKGIELAVTGENRSIVRLFFAQNRFYLLIAKQKAASFDEQRRVLDSFRSLNLADYNAALLKEHDPATLPQDIPSGIRPTDAMEAGLKGSVKMITEDVEKGSVKKTRYPASVENFSRLGHLTRRVTYYEGYLETIGNFGWVDGIRAVNLAPITHMLERSIVTRRAVVGFGAREGYNKIMRAPDGTYHDFRYTSKFETKYDDQWLPIERREISNSGDVNHIEKIVITKTGRDIRTEDNSGGFLSRRFEVIDTDGNISELRTLDDRDGVQSTIKYQYEFDDKGNWVVRRSFTLLKGRSTPSATHYRKIEYHQGSDLDARPTNEVVTF